MVGRGMKSEISSILKKIGVEVHIMALAGNKGLTHAIITSQNLSID